METAQQYHNNEASHGSYQFVTLKEVIDGLLTNKLEDDSYLKNTNRALLIYHGKMGLKELTKSVSKITLAIEMTVGDNSCIVMPQDFVDYRRISVVAVDELNGSRHLQVLDVNNNINTADGYLQDNNAQILFDNNGGILKADASNAYNIAYTAYNILPNRNTGSSVDTSKFTKNGEFKIDENKGKIVFSSNLINKEVVIEYLSDGLQWEEFNEGEIKVHKYIEQCLKDWIYYSCIEGRITVPQNEKRRALDRYKTTKHEARKSNTALDLNEVLRQMRTKSKLL